MGFRTVFYEKRKFCIDMAGFAINLKLFIESPTVQFVATKRVSTVPFFSFCETIATEFVSEFQLVKYNCSNTSCNFLLSLDSGLRASAIGKYCEQQIIILNCCYKHMNKIFLFGAFKRSKLKPKSETFIYIETLKFFSLCS